MSGRFTDEIARDPAAASPRTWRLAAWILAGLGVANVLRYARAATVDGAFRPDAANPWVLVVGVAMLAGALAFALLARRAGPIT
jgi:hypothetical protein